MFLLVLVFVLMDFVSVDSKHHVTPSNATNFWYEGGSLKGPLAEDWIPLTIHEAFDFYTAHEICKLTTRDNCENEPGNVGASCDVYDRGIAHTNNWCSNLAGSMFRHKTIDKNSYKYMDLVMHQLSQGSNAIIFMGDSLTSQSFSDAQCSSRRLGFNQMSYDENIFPGTYSNFCFEYPDKKSAMYEELMSKYPVLSKLSAHTDCYFISIYIHYDGPWEDEKVIPTINGLLQNKYIHGKILFLTNIGLHLHGEDAMKESMVKLINVMYPAIQQGHQIMFREVGAQHFPMPDGQYIEHLFGDHKSRISEISIIQQLKMFPNSYSTTHPYDPNDVLTSTNTVNEIKYGCYPIHNITMAYLQNWRNRIAKHMIHGFNRHNLSITTTSTSTSTTTSSILKKSSSSNDNTNNDNNNDKNNNGIIKPIIIIPWYDITMARYDYHVASYGDCTHFCFGPNVFAPIWNYIGRYLYGKIH